MCNHNRRMGMGICVNICNLMSNIYLHTYICMYIPLLHIILYVRRYMHMCMYYNCIQMLTSTAVLQSVHVYKSQGIPEFYTQNQESSNTVNHGAHSTSFHPIVRPCTNDHLKGKLVVLLLRTFSREAVKLLR